MRTAPKQRIYESVFGVYSKSVYGIAVKSFSGDYPRAVFTKLRN